MGTGQALGAKVTSFEPFENHKGVPRLMTLQGTKAMHLVPETGCFYTKEKGLEPMFCAMTFYFHVLLFSVGWGSILAAY